jgi:AbiV family abortive infection protein
MDENLILRNLVEQLGHAAAGNALELVEEADLLDANGHRARAFALTVLAAEELGKALICTMTVAHAHEFEDWTALVAMVRGHKKHEVKLLAALFLIQKVLGLTGEPVDRLAQELYDLVAGDLDDAKMRALYVDIEGGAVATPAKVADHEGAQRRARALRREVGIWAIVMGGGSGEGQGAE